MSKVWTEDKIDMVKTYLRNGMTTKQIAKKMDVSLDSLGNAIRRYDLSEHKVPKQSTSKYVENINFEELDDDMFDEQKQKAMIKWKIKKPKKSKVKKNFEMALFWPDTHIPHHDEKSCSAVLQLMNEISIDKFVIMGDYMDFGCISHWNKNKHRTLELKRLKTDYIEGNALLDAIDSNLPKKCDKYYLKGNHEVWVKDLLEEVPALEGMIEPETMLHLTERDYKVYDYNDLVKIGRLFVTHGMYAGGNPIKKHVDELKVNIAFGHTHTLGMQLFSSPARDLAFVGYNVGCLANLSPDYMKNRPNSWVHGFAIGYFYPNGHFDMQLIRIIDGKFIFNGKVYEGKK
jgi:transposase-like protein/predicted phosphodiesterase